MAKILIVDDQPTSRQFLLTLLGYQDHRLFEAADGAEALDLVRAERPDLVISDILMPRMDGIEFARRLRAEPGLATTRLIFYTATYRVEEAERLARACGVEQVLSKPADPETLLNLVRRALGTAEAIPAQPRGQARAAPPPAPGGAQLGQYDPVAPVLQRAMQSITELAGAQDQPQEALATLSEHLGELRTRVGRLYALLELSLELAALREPDRLLKQFCAGTRRLFAAQVACVAILDRNEQLVCQLATDGMDPAAAEALAKLSQLEGALADALAARRPLRLADHACDRPQLPAAHPLVNSLLAVPLLSATRLHGLVWFAGKVDAVGFTADDEALATVLARALTLLYENLDLYGLVQHHAAELELEVGRRRQAEQDVRRLNRVYAMLSDINSLIVRVRQRQALFDSACRLAIEKGGFALAWLGLLDEASGQLVPVAAAAEQPDDIALARIAASRYALALDSPAAAALRARRSFVSNDVENDATLFTRAETAARGMRSLIALPLAVGTRLLGMLMFYSRTPGFFDAQEVRLLEELAGDVSFAIDHIDKEERLDYLAYYDVLTGLPNRSLFRDRLGSSLETAAANGQPRVAVVLVDLERFRFVNESLGRHAGDAFLQQVAQRLKSVTATQNDLARIGADCFALQYTGLSQPDEAARLFSQQLMACFNEPFLVDTHELRMSCKAGIAVFPDDGTDAEALLTNADAALRNAKACGERYLFYAAEMNRRVTESLRMETRLRRALELGHFVLHYQPKVDSGSRTLTGLEALIRWNDPETGLVLPGHFIPLMEETGLILEVGQWVLEKAMSDFAAWRARGLRPPPIAVNVAARQLRQKDFVQGLAALLRDSGAGESALELEITETMVMEDIEANTPRLRALREMGVGIAIDDFGTGHSSLKYLAKLPASALKIDRHFVSTLTTDTDSAALTAMVIELAHSLKLKVIAEGIETEEQATCLRLMRCDELQGYLIGRPLPPDEIEALLARS